MHINSIAGRTAHAAKSTSEAGVRPLASTYSDVESARQIAFSALHNDRFSIMLEAISKPGATNAFLTMQSEKSGKGLDHHSAFAGYAENSEE